MGGRAKANAKISVTVRPETLDRIDRGVRGKRWPSRSAVVQAALDDWASRDRERAGDAEIEAYYLNRTPAEVADDDEWSSFADGEFVAL